MLRKFLFLSLNLLSIFILIKNSPCEELNINQDEAVRYRLEGLAAQQKGDLDTAFNCFQKAINISPSYAVARNDLGIMYEERGWLDRAESEYLEAIKINPNYLPAYSNLALLYESKQDTEKAILYWRQRSKLGLENDPWVIKAKENLRRLNAPLEEPVIVEVQEAQEDKALQMENMLIEEAEMLSKSVTLDKQIDLQQNQNKFLEHKSKGESYFKDNNFELALEEFRNARNFNPSDTDINLLVEDAEAKYIESLITTHFNNGLELYRQKDLQQAQNEFKKILNILSTIMSEHEKIETYAASK